MVGGSRTGRAAAACPRSPRGAAAVEFALILVPFLLLIFGMIQYGMYFYSAQTGSHVANSAVRELSVGNCQTKSQLDTYVSSRLGAAKNGTLTVDTPVYKNIDQSTPANPQAQNVTIGGTVKLTITFQTLNMHFPFLPFLSDPTVSRTVEARVEDNTDQGCPSA